MCLSVGGKTGSAKFRLLSVRALAFLLSDTRYPCSPSDLPELQLPFKKYVGTFLMDALASRFQIIKQFFPEHRYNEFLNLEECFRLQVAFGKYAFGVVVRFVSSLSSCDSIVSVHRRTTPCTALALC